MTNQTDDWLDELITNYEVDVYCATIKDGSDVDGVQHEELEPYRKKFKVAIKAKFTEQRDSQFKVLETRHQRMLEDIEIEHTKFIEELERRHAEEVRAARADEVSKALQAGSIRTIPTKDGNVVEWWPDGLNRVLNDRLQHLTSQKGKE